MPTELAKAEPSAPTTSTWTFPAATKVEPLYKTATGYHKRLLEKDAKNRPDAVRHMDSDTGKIIWLIQLTMPAAK